MQTVSPDHLIDKVRPETNRVEMLAALADKPLTGRFKDISALASYPGIFEIAPTSLDDIAVHR